LVPSIEFVFSETGAAKFRALLDKLWKEREQDYFSARGIAVLLNGEVFLHLHSSPSPPPGPAWQVELTREEFPEVVSYIESTLGCS
jgi:hypothetical protein